MQASASVCQKTYDVCKHPSKVDAALAKLDHFSLRRISCGPGSGFIKRYCGLLIKQCPILFFLNNFVSISIRFCFFVFLSEKKKKDSPRSVINPTKFIICLSWLSRLAHFWGKKS